MISSRSHRLTVNLSVLLAAAALTCAPAALADIAAPEYCPANDSLGQSCSTAGPNFDEDGTCQEVACDGGNGPCGLLCELAPDAGPVTNPPDAGPVPPEDAGSDDSGITLPPTYDSGTISQPPIADSGTSMPPLNTDAGAGTPDAGTNTNGAGGNTSSSLQSSCSTMGPGGQAGGGFFVLGAVGLLLSAASRRRRKA